jgi:hypothetical protein
MPQIVLGFVALVAACSFALGNAAPASAHYTDSYHRHGYAWGGANPTCYSGYNGSGYIVINPPNFVTTPVRSTSLGGNGVEEKVWYYAVLEWAYSNGNTWSPAANSYYTPTWYWTRANNNGLVIYWWVDNNTGRWAGNTLYSVWLLSGFKYRFHLYYYWSVDGQRHDEVTSSCSV